ncbi:uncharacterized protein L201_006339 [Kwoniella dendrophila CBS 6074]|uniref:Uncharacterized protein n=1 Tax=Kwoniella dendrophila CBS 6074 TaxID=1295534 RepID=A0AAX4K3K9_9TREE
MSSHEVLQAALKQYQDDQALSAVTDELSEEVEKLRNFVLAQGDDPSCVGEIQFRVENLTDKATASNEKTDVGSSDNRKLIASSGVAGSTRSSTPEQLTEKDVDTKTSESGGSIQAFETFPELRQAYSNGFEDTSNKVAHEAVISTVNNVVEDRILEHTMRGLGARLQSVMNDPTANWNTSVPGNQEYDEDGVRIAYSGSQIGVNTIYQERLEGGQSYTVRSWRTYL